MPVKKMTLGRSSNHDLLVRELLAEWNTPQSGKPEPVIIEEPGAGGTAEHIYVIWTEWSQVDRVERSEIIMEAAEQRFSPAQASHITIAMGLTPDEAARMGIRY